jgi:MFS family permease
VLRRQTGSRQPFTDGTGRRNEALEPLAVPPNFDALPDDLDQAKQPLLSWSLRRILVANAMCMAGSLMFFMLPPYLKQNGMAPWGLGCSEGIFWAVSVLIQPWLGPNLDRLGRRPFFLLGALILSVAAAGFAFIPVLVAPVLALRALQGAGFALYLTAAWSWVTDAAHAANPKKVGTVFGLFGLSSLLGSVCGPATAEIVSKQPGYGYHAVFLTASSILGLAFLLLLTLKDAERQDSGSDPVQSEPTPYLKLAVSPAMRSATCGSIGFGLAFGCISGMGSAFLSDLHLGGISAMFACILLAAAMSRVGCGVLIDRIGSIRLIIPSLLLLVVGMVGLGALSYVRAASQPAVMIVAGLVAGLGYGAVYPALIALGSGRMPPEARGRALSLITACIDLGDATGPVIAGVLATRCGFSLMFFIMGGLVACVSVLFGLLEAASPRPR